jgi:hypothetical protein
VVKADVAVRPGKTAEKYVVGVKEVAAVADGGILSQASKCS